MIKNQNFQKVKEKSVCWCSSLYCACSGFLFSVFCTY